ncbi:MAG: FG-GAP repeat protein, partial [Methanoregula sp.]
MCVIHASAAVLTIGDLTGENVTGLITSAGTSPGIPSVTQVDGGITDPFAEINKKVGPDDASALKSLIRNTIYAFSYDPTAGAWYARNAEKQIVFSCSKNGTAEFSNTMASFRLSLSGIGRENSIEPVPDGKISMDGRQLNITRPTFTEWYRNTDTGVEQGLDLNNRPEGAGPVQIRFAISGNGTFAPGTGQALTVTDAAGNALFSYTGLHATDAAGLDIPVSLATDGRMLLWIVDDRNATYPVTIDPVIVPASTAKGKFTGVGGDFFGYSVAMSQDGSQCLIGAPDNSSAGAAYLFVEPTGGWTGTTSTSDATAMFTGGAGGNQFGTSVAMSEDGSRVIIGANYNDTAGVQAGAAYLFAEPTGGWAGT